MWSMSLIKEAHLYLIGYSLVAVMAITMWCIIILYVTDLYFAILTFSCATILFAACLWCIYDIAHMTDDDVIKVTLKSED